jgi:5-formyltetrahydrofolate cyclo-ligase
MKKEELRKIYYQKRLLVDEIQRKKLIKKILQELKKHTLVNKYVSIYLPIKRNNEIDTYPIIELIEKMGGKIIVPKSNFQTGVMTHYLFTKKTRLKLNEFGIPEPIEEKAVQNSQIDIVLLPLLIFDQVGHRVGYGKGFYDRFLSDCRADTIKIGLCDFSSVEEISPVLASDIALDFCITMDKLYTFKKDE